MLAHVAVMYIRGFHPGFAALAFANSCQERVHCAPSGTARITSGFFDAMLVTCDVGGLESVDLDRLRVDDVDLGVRGELRGTVSR